MSNNIITDETADEFDFTDFTDISNITHLDNTKSNTNAQIENDNELINENNISNNVYNHYTNKQFEEYNNLINYIRPFEKNKSDIINLKPNICDVYQKKAYIIPDRNIEKFMDLLNNCNKKKELKLNFTELQLSDIDNNIGSGLMFDFDILQDEKYSKLNTFGFANLITEILKVIETVLDFNPCAIRGISIRHFAAIIKKIDVEFKDNENKYKDGFHILFPSIKTTKEVKKYIFSKLLKSDRIKMLFEQVDINDELCDIMDKGSYSVPVHFVGNCKVNKEPYKFHQSYAMTYTSLGFQVPEIFPNQEPELKNICYEFSLNYDCASNIIKKYYYKALESVKDEIDYLSEKKDINDDYMDTNINDISILTLHNPNAKFIRELLYLLSDERSHDRNKWRDVIYAIANEGIALKPLILEFSKRNTAKWDPVGFEKMWADALSSSNTDKLTIRSLIYWARNDSPKEYEEIINKNIKQKIKTDICSDILCGKIFHYQYATYLYHMFSEKFITDDVAGKTVWYEFVIENDRYIKGQVYKWREEPKPDNLYIYISKVLPIILSQIMRDIDDYVKTIKDNESLMNYFIQIKKNINSSAHKLYDTGFKTKLIKEAESLFRKRGFSDSLNKDQTIIGVGNGVLVLSDKPHLITSYHNFPITIFSPIDYIDYDENNPNVQLLEKTMKELFPPTELDVLEFLLYYFASCLDGKPKDSIILIITGIGSNGKSFLLNLVKEVFGNEYCRRMPLAFLTDKRSKSASADPVLMDLEHARLAHYSESEKHEELNTSKMKEITGQESLSGRNLYEKQRNFRPTCHHIITTNHDFDIKTTDNGTWRRIKKYTFKMIFKSKKDIDLNNPFEKEENVELAQEFSYNPRIKEAFLSILVNYYKNLYLNYDGKLNKVPKPTIDKETEVYRNSQDDINRFINDTIIVSKHGEIDIQELIDLYKQWYSNNIDNSDIKIPNAELGKKLMNSKISKYIQRNKNGIRLTGLRTVETGIPDTTKDEEYLCASKQSIFINSD